MFVVGGRSYSSFLECSAKVEKTSNEVNIAKENSKVHETWELHTTGLPTLRVVPLVAS